MITVCISQTSMREQTVDLTAPAAMPSRRWLFGHCGHPPLLDDRGNPD